MHECLDASSPTRPVLYPCCCSLLAKVVSLGGSPPEAPRKRSTCTRPVLPIPDPQRRASARINRQGADAAARSLTGTDRVAAGHESGAAWRAEGSSSNVLSQLYTLGGKSVDIGRPAGKPDL